jgi:hypothetical protein
MGERERERERERDVPAVKADGPMINHLLHIGLPGTFAAAEQPVQCVVVLRLTDVEVRDR